MSEAYFLLKKTFLMRTKITQKQGFFVRFSLHKNCRLVSFFSGRKAALVRITPEYKQTKRLKIKMGKKKSREYSSDSDGSSDSEEIEKRKKHKKSSKKSKKSKSKKKKRHHSSSSESESQDAWIEQNVDKKKSPTPPPSKQREDWMSADNFFIPTFSKEKQLPKAAAEKAKLEVYDPVTSTRELNPYFKTGEGGMPSFQKPKDNDDDYRRSSTKPSQSGSSGNWRKPRQEENRRRERNRSRSRSPAQKSRSWQKEEVRRERSRSSSRSRSVSPVEEKQRVMLPARPEPADNVGITAAHSDFLTDQQMNEIGAKMIKAELMGNTTLAEKLKAKLERAKAFKGSGKAPPQTADRESVVLSITNAAGVSRPVTQREEPRGRHQDKKKKNKRVETHIDGERTQYYADDGKYDIKQMVSLFVKFCNFC